MKARIGWGDPHSGQLSDFPRIDYAGILRECRRILSLNLGPPGPKISPTLKIMSKSVLDTLHSVKKCLI